jgi:hypothetical protein
MRRFFGRTKKRKAVLLRKAVKAKGSRGFAAEEEEAGKDAGGPSDVSGGAPSGGPSGAFVGLGSVHCAPNGGSGGPKSCWERRLPAGILQDGPHVVIIPVSNNAKGS